MVNDNTIIKLVQEQIKWLKYIKKYNIKGVKQAMSSENWNVTVEQGK